MIIEEGCYLEHVGKKSITRIDRVANATAIKKAQAKSKVKKGKPLLYNTPPEEVAKKTGTGREFIRKLFVGGAGYINLKDVVPVSQ